jgi:hypothetical protein
LCRNRVVVYLVTVQISGNLVRSNWHE